MGVKVERFPIPGPAMLTPKRHRDDRGYLAETFQAARFDEALGMAAVVQELPGAAAGTGEAGGRIGR